MKSSQHTFKIITTFILLFTVPFASTGQDVPINPDTRLVSISNIVTINNVSQQEIKHRIEEWLALRSNSFQTLFNGVQNTYTKKKDKNKHLAPPSFMFEKKVDTDSKSIYLLVFDDTPAESRFEKSFKKGVVNKTIVQANFILLIKDEKLKYELTNFAHTSSNAVAAGGYFENERPDAKRVYMNKRDWKEQKRQAIEKAKVLASDFENYILHPVNTEMNF